MVVRNAVGAGVALWAAKAAGTRERRVDAMRSGRMDGTGL
jgi:hypothetical protein